MTFEYMHPVVCAQCGGVDRGDRREDLIPYRHPARGLIWVVHEGGCARDFFARQRKRLRPLLRHMQRFDSSVWGPLQTRIGVAAWADPAIENPGSFVHAVQDALNELGRTPMRAVCTATGAGEKDFFRWCEELAAVLRDFNMKAQLKGSASAHPRLLLPPPGLVPH